MQKRRIKAIRKRKWMPVKHFADYVGVDQSTVYRWIRSGKIPYIEADGKLAVPVKLAISYLRRWGYDV